MLKNGYKKNSKNIFQFKRSKQKKGIQFSLNPFFNKELSSILLNQPQL